MSVIEYTIRNAKAFDILKGKDGSLILSYTLPEPEKDCPLNLIYQKTIGIKWTSSPEEYDIHHKLSEMNKKEIIPCFGGATGKFNFANVVPKAFQESIKKQICCNLLNKHGSLNTKKMESLIVMPSMDFSLDNALPYFTLKQRQRYIPVLQRIYEEAARTMAKIGRFHGDMRPRNIFLKIKNGKYVRTYIADFNNTKKLKSKASQENVTKKIEEMVTKAKYTRYPNKSPFADNLEFLDGSTDTPTASPIKSKKCEKNKRNVPPLDMSPKALTKRLRMEDTMIFPENSAEQLEGRNVKRRIDDSLELLLKKA